MANHSKPPKVTMVNLSSSATWGLLVVASTVALGLLASVITRRAATFASRTCVATLFAVGLSSVGVLASLPRPEPAWLADYQTGNLAQWSEVHVARPDAVVVVSGPTSDDYDEAGRFTVMPGDRTFGQTDEERAEVMASSEQSGAREGQTNWHGWSTYFTAGTVVEPGGWLAFSQWHQDGNRCPPNVAFHISDDDQPRMFLALRGGDLNLTTCEPEYKRNFDLGPLKTGRWTDFKVHATWSSDPDRGRFQVEVNGAASLPEGSVANLYSGQGAYFKQGIYRANMERTTTVYHAGTAQGRSSSSISLRVCEGEWRFPLLRAVAWC